jgi:hypothetical protein
MTAGSVKALINTDARTKKAKLEKGLAEAAEASCQASGNR